jgi:hypothetical protein
MLRVGPAQGLELFGAGFSPFESGGEFKIETLSG